MNFHDPIYTEKTECQDCFKCVRECPVKAIKVEGGYASVISSLCILCGHCVDVCPHNAKRTRRDLPRAKEILSRKQRVIASVAPSIITEFPSFRPGQLVAALRRLGFHAVSETALGAQIVSQTIAERLKEEKDAILLSTACPTVVEYIQKYHPEYASNLTHLLSPALSHAKMLRQLYGNEIGVIFIGPCIAKKREADLHPFLLDLALTFQGLREWWTQAGIDPETMVETEEDVFQPYAAGKGSLYPIEGGMIAGVRDNCSVSDSHFMSFSGIDNIDRALKGLGEFHPEGSVFVELLACEGGCVNGPKAARRHSSVFDRYRVIRHVETTAAASSIDSPPAIEEAYHPQPVPGSEYGESRIREVLARVGKTRPEDELNCGGCGYDSCREFARAFIDGKAERTMCVSYMRALAQKKAHALIRKMPSAVVIVDHQLKILECNPRFVRFFAKEKAAESSFQSLEGVDLEEILPFTSLFESVLETGEDILERDIRWKKRILHSSIFSIEKNSIVGALFEDITQPALQREQIVERSRQVIQQNLQTVQKIAYLLGENAAESEIILNSIVESFQPQDVEEPE